MIFLESKFKCESSLSNKIQCLMILVSTNYTIFSFANKNNKVCWSGFFLSEMKKKGICLANVVHFFSVNGEFL